MVVSQAQAGLPLWWAPSPLAHLEMLLQLDFMLPCQVVVLLLKLGEQELLLKLLLLLEHQELLLQLLLP